MTNKDRIAELEQIIEHKRATMSKTSFRSWHCMAPEVMELCELKSATQNAEAIAQKRNDDWKNDPATDRQIAYLKRLKVVIENRMTKARASELIDAAKGDHLGSVGGWYTDGSN